MKRERDEERFKKKERNPLIVLVFSCVVLFYHTLPPSNVCACVCVCACSCMCVCIKALPSHSSLFLCPSYITLSLPPPFLPLPPAFFIVMSYCSPAIPSDSIENISLQHTPACLKKWQSNLSNQEHETLCCSSDT